MSDLDILTVRLEGKNLIEASAGTGKTYSIAILVLRMILEKSSTEHIKDILVVTFTNAAAGELRERIRHFVQKAYSCVQTGTSEDMTISSIVETAINLSGKDEVLYKIRRSLSLMDEAPVMTIHSFVQKTLNDHPFYSYQSFDTELIPDADDWIEEQVIHFWRKYITELSPGIIGLLGDLETLKNDAARSLKYRLDGKKPWMPDKLKAYTAAQYLEEFLPEKIFRDMDTLYEELRMKWENEKNIILARLADLNITRKPENTYKKWGNDFNSFMKKFTEAYRKGSQYIFNSSGYFFDDVHRYIRVKDSVQEQIIEFKALLFHGMTEEFYPLIEKKIQENNVLTFDGMIKALRQRLTEPGGDRLTEALREKYKAVFIDEFQDTDHDQFIIFKSLFFTNAGSTAFIIGDPKQSIYAFRSADIDSYLAAKSLMDHTYTMTVNYRSSPDMIAAQNTFFNSLDKKEIFGYSADDDIYIQYEDVSADKKARLMKSNQHINEVLTFHGYDNKMDALDNLVNAVTQLLSPEQSYAFSYTLSGNEDDTRPLLPSDIGILVRGKGEGRIIKNELSRIGIPSVQMFDEKILHTPEALQIAFLLEAFIDPNLDMIRRAVYYSFLQHIPEYFHRNRSVQPDENTLIPYFSKYNEYILQNKTFEALYAFLEDFGVRQYFSVSEEHAHIISHIEQILQLINTYQYRTNATSGEVAAWLRDNHFGVINDGDEYTAILESDESAVKIITIHKSKGLEFPVTLIYGIDKKPYVQDHAITFFKLPGEEQMFYTQSTLIDNAVRELILRRQEQEDRRLLYVALTRAIFRCYHFFSISKKEFSGSGLRIILDKMDQVPSDYVSIYLNEAISRQAVSISHQDKVITEAVYDPEKVRNFQSHQLMLSYSGLSRSHDIYMPPENIAGPAEDTEYDQFIFKTLPRGAYTGTLVHELFQEMDPGDFKSISSSLFPAWAYLPSVRNLAYILKDRYSEEQTEHFLYHVFNAILADRYHGAVITLSDIPRSQMLHELEFNFHLHIPDTGRARLLLSRFDANAEFKDEKVKGLMNGFIDLIFIYKDKYYILDWKTNHLGNHTSFYASDHLYQAMTVNNYHLQYLIYTVALHRYLTERLAAYDYEKHFGGVFYLFVRGCRAGGETGVFYSRPQATDIEELNKLLDDDSVAL